MDIMKLMWTLLLGALVPFAATALEVEAEAGAVTGPTAVFANEKASGGKTVLFKTNARGMKAPAKDEVPALIVKAKIEQAGKYQIAVVVFTPNTSSDSVFAAIDDATPEGKHFGFPHSGVTRVICKMDLTAGEHQIKFWPREPNLQIDKIMITPTK